MRKSGRCRQEESRKRAQSELVEGPRRVGSAGGGRAHTAQDSDSTLRVERETSGACCRLTSLDTALSAASADLPVACCLHKAPAALSGQAVNLMNAVVGQQRKVMSARRLELSPAASGIDERE